MRNDSSESSLFADNLMDTYPNQPHRKEERYNGSNVQDDSNAKVRDGLNRITSRETVLNPVSMIFSYTYDSIFIRSSKCSCIECMGDSIE